VTDRFYRVKNPRKVGVLSFPWRRMLKFRFFLDMTLRHGVIGSRRFEVTYYHRIPGFIWNYGSLKTKALGPFKSSGSCYPVTHVVSPKNRILIWKVPKMKSYESKTYKDLQSRTYSMSVPGIKLYVIMRSLSKRYRDYIMEGVCWRHVTFDVQGLPGSFNNGQSGSSVHVIF
jgi:hypothetical protein